MFTSFFFFLEVYTGWLRTYFHWLFLGIKVFFWLMLSFHYLEGFESLLFLLLRNSLRGCKCFLSNTTKEFFISILWNHWDYICLYSEMACLYQCSLTELKLFRLFDWWTLGSSNVRKVRSILFGNSYSK